MPVVALPARHVKYGSIVPPDDTYPLAQVKELIFPTLCIMFVGEFALIIVGIVEVQYDKMAVNIKCIKILIKCQSPFQII